MHLETPCNIPLFSTKLFLYLGHKTNQPISFRKMLECWMIDWGVKLLSASLPSLHHWKKASFGDPPFPQIDQQEQYFISESTTCSQQQQSRNDPCTLRTLPIRCSVWCLPLSPSLHHFQVLSPFAREHAYVLLYIYKYKEHYQVFFFCLST